MENPCRSGAGARRLRTAARKTIALRNLASSHGPPGISADAGEAKGRRLPAPNAPP